MSLAKLPFCAASILHLSCVEVHVQIVFFLSSLLFLTFHFHCGACIFTNAHAYAFVFSRIFDVSTLPYT